jgi:geranylgeranyl diphosphate synthase type II
VDVQAYFRERIPLVDRVLDAAIPAADTPPVPLHSAMRHILFPGGKRLRPVLAIAAAEAVGAPGERALPVAAAVEFVHTYSLIHDDLPCMDDDDERRGGPAVHVVYGEAVAVLAGDALLAAAFEVLSQPGNGVGASELQAACREVARAAGSLALVGGQADDLVFESSETNATRIESVHARKSGALIAASIVGGAQLGGADPEMIERMRRCGQAAGVAFQIADDVLDEGEDDPCSLVRALGVDAARDRSEELLSAALAELEALGERAEPLRELVRFSVRRSV